jgi:hypothetical protein
MIRGSPDEDWVEPFFGEGHQRGEESLVVPVFEKSRESLCTDEVGEVGIGEASFVALGGLREAGASSDEDEAPDAFRMSDGPMQGETPTHGIAYERDRLSLADSFGDEVEVRFQGVFRWTTLMYFMAVAREVRSNQFRLGRKEGAQWVEVGS